MVFRYWPLGAGRVITSPFGSRDGGFHAGVDFGRAGGSAGMTVYAVQSGTVIFAGAAQGYGGPDPAGWLVIDSTDAEGGGCLEYGHIVRDAAVTVGAHVTAGQRIGVINPNRATNAGVAPHLHLSDMPGAYSPAAKQNPLPRLSGALEPGQAAPTTPVGGTPVTGWTGDPTWLADVVRPAVDKFVEYPGWRNRGHGDFKDIRGVMLHHTGGPANAASIANGRPDLDGPLANIHIDRDGVVTIVAVGVCWHAGVGSWPWLPTNMGNWHLIGIEAEWPYGEPGINERNAGTVPWRRPQIIAIRNTIAALLGRMQFGADRLLGHKDYAGPAQGKWDPGNMSMAWMRGEVQKDLAGFVFPGEDGPRPVVVPTPPPTIPLPPAPSPDYAGVLLYRGMTGPAVAKLQNTLRRWYSKLAVDGDYGPATEAAVRDFQRLRPPLAADGIVGPATAARMGLVL